MVDDDGGRVNAGQGSGRDPAPSGVCPTRELGDDREVAEGPRTYHRSTFPVDRLVAAKAGRTVTVCIPARDEAPTVGAVVRAVRRPLVAGAGGTGLVDEVLVVDNGSSDATAAAARDAGARVLTTAGDGGKGRAMLAGLEAAAGDLIVYLDADVENTTPTYVTGLLGPLLVEEDVALVKGFYRRPLRGEPTGGGRVTELVARPLLEVLFPELVAIRQPLAGETAAPRWVLDKLDLADGYGVELGLLVDVARRFGAGAVAQVDLGVRIHRNRTLDELRPQAVEILRAALDRAGPLPPAAR